MSESTQVTKLKKIRTIKNEILNALEEKGTGISEETAFADYYTYIDVIEGSTDKYVRKDVIGKCYIDDNYTSE